MDDMVRVIKLYNIVKMGIPGTTQQQLLDFMKKQDPERQKWFAKASIFDMADWVVEKMREEEKEG